jgi:phosphoglycolate phosphatase-like HAD superfamily hydrolase
VKAAHYVAECVRAIMILTLFDIDGTLLTTEGGARLAFGRALSEAAGRPISPDGYSFSGRTDPQIARDILAAHGVAGEALETAVRASIRLYLEHFEAALRAGQTLVRTLPGVPELLERLGRTPGVRTGLLTGNVEPGARLKLSAAGLERCFDFTLSCFGSDDADRYRLPALALERARRVLGPEIRGDRLVIVGDSEHDVLCGRSIGARAVAVGTGWTPIHKLRALRPHALLEDFTDTERALAALLDGRDSCRAR